MVNSTPYKFDFDAHDEQRSMDHSSQSESPQLKANNTRNDVPDLVDTNESINWEPKAKKASVFEQITNRKPFNFKSLYGTTDQPMNDNIYDTTSTNSAYKGNRGVSTSITAGLRYSSARNDTHKSVNANRRMSTRSTTKKMKRYPDRHDINHFTPREQPMVEDDQHIPSFSRPPIELDLYNKQPHYDSVEQAIIPKAIMRKTRSGSRMNKISRTRMNNLWNDIPKDVKTRQIKRRSMSKINIQSEPKVIENTNFKKITGLCILLYYKYIHYLNIYVVYRFTRVSIRL